MEDAPESNASRVRPKNPMSRQPLFTATKTALVGGVIIGASGCAQKRAEVWSPRPLVLWEDISTGVVPHTKNAYEIIPASPSHGLFPASMAVTRIGIEIGTEASPGVRSNLLADPRNEFLQWNSTLDDQMAVSEVFPIHDVDLGGRRVSPHLIVDAFQALGARLGLLYGVNELSEHKTEMLAVLYDTETVRPLAVLHADAKSEYANQANADAGATMWETDSQALARTRFDELLHACIRDLILQDESPPVAVPAGWPPPDPTRGVTWPPTRRQRRP